MLNPESCDLSIYLNHFHNHSRAPQLYYTTKQIDKHGDNLFRTDQAATELYIYIKESRELSLGQLE